MATFEEQVEGLTSLTITGSSAPTQNELSQFLSDGAMEVINAMPSNLKRFCATEDTFTSTAVGSEAETLDSAQVLSVTRNDGTIEQPCRLISSTLRGRASDSDDMNAATTTDPVYYIYNGKLNALPASGSCKYLEVNNPSVAYGDSAIGNFPDEYEYLVPLYASIKSLQNVLGSRSTNSSVTTAFSAMKAELDETQAVCDSVNADLVLAKAEIVIAKAEAAEIAVLTDSASGSSAFNVAVGAIKTELDKVDDIIDLANDEFDEVSTQVSGSKDSPITDAFTEFEKISPLLVAGEADTESDVNAALVLLKAAVDQAAVAAGKFLTVDSDSVFGDESTFLTNDSQLTRVKAALDDAEDLINGDEPSATTDAYGAQANEDIELAASAVNIAQSEIRRAQAHLSEWTAIGDMRVKEVNAALSEANGYATEIQSRLQQAQSKREEAQSRIASGNAYLQEADSIIKAGNAYLQEAQGRIAQAQGYATEVNARDNFASAKTKAVQSYINTAQSYVATAQGFSNQVQAKIAIAQGYGSEIQSRMQVDREQYSFYEKQQVKLQTDYDKGIQIMRGS